MEAQLSKFAVAPAASSPEGQGPRVSARKAKLRAALSLATTNIILLLILPAAILISTSIGPVRIPMHDLLAALFHHQALSQTQHTILFEIRLPRVLASAVVGASLALSGLMFQGLFRNPLADPYIIGASGGAAFGACIGIVFLAQFSLFGFSATALLAFAGALVTMVVVYTLARSKGSTSGVTLLLAGFAVGTMLANSTYLFEIIDPNPTFGHRIVIAWLHGSIGVPEWPQLGLSSLFFALAALAAMPLMRRLNTLALGDEYAHQLGMRVEATRIGIILVGSVLTAIAVSLGGLINFAGLIVPHFVRMLIGPDHVRLLPTTILSGAIFLIATDSLARTLFAPSEMPVGILMVFVGGPFFLYLLRKGKREYTL